MAIIDFILNLAGVLLWLSWRSTNFDPLAQSRPASLVGTLKRTEPHSWRRWHFLGALAVLVLMRSWLYWQIGAAVDWTPSIELGAIAVPFRSDYFLRILLYSVLSFVAALVVLYSWLLLLSMVNGRTAENLPLQRLVRLHLGPLDRAPWWVKLSLPMVVVALLWFGLTFLLEKVAVLPPAHSLNYRVQQALIVGVGPYLTWRFLAGAILALYLVSSYVYFGRHVLWDFVAITGRNMVKPLGWLPLQFGKVDLAPIVGIAAVFLLSEGLERGVRYVYPMLPFTIGF